MNETKQVILPDGQVWGPGFIRRLDRIDQTYVRNCVREFIHYAKRQNKRRPRPASIETPIEFVPDGKPTRNSIDGSVRCRQILELLAMEALTAKELAARLDLADQSLASKTIRKNNKYFVVVGEQRSIRNVSNVWSLSDAGKVALSQAPTPAQRVIKQDFYIKQRGKSPAAKKQDANQRFLEWLAVNQPATIGQISLGLRLSRRGVDRRIATLISADLIVVVEKRRLGGSLKPTNFYEVQQKMIKGTVK